ncbi:hypothetical protein E3N88_15111 [Mikania micrantha]|uniref:Uncharacterized protein n=1 Tax=Mikania micrantha TaxID=192012 RepID=A0A5N6NWC1_9ASTR|nr:hypothetical protein E3N88_15111 [Mikania micrantha]
MIDVEISALSSRQDQGHDFIIYAVAVGVVQCVCRLEDARGTRRAGGWRQKEGSSELLSEEWSKDSPELRNDELGMVAGDRVGDGCG